MNSYVYNQHCFSLGKIELTSSHIWLKEMKEMYISCVHLCSNGINTATQGYTVKWALFLIFGCVAFTLWIGAYTLYCDSITGFEANCTEQVNLQYTGHIPVCTVLNTTAIVTHLRKTACIKFRFCAHASMPYGWIRPMYWDLKYWSMFKGLTKLHVQI